MQKKILGGDAGQESLLFLGADAQDQRAGLAIGDPMQGNWRTGGEHLLQRHVAFQEGAFLTAVLLRPGHADPAPLPHRAAEIRIHAGPRFGALHRLAAGKLLR